MDPKIFASVCVVFAGLALLPHRAVWLRAAAFLAFVAALAVFWFAVAGTPRAELLGMPAGRVLAAAPRQAAGVVYLWVLPDDRNGDPAQPVAVTVPWYGQAAADKLQEDIALAQARRANPVQTAGRRALRAVLGLDAAKGKSANGSRASGAPEGKMEGWPEPQPGLPPKSPMN